MENYTETTNNQMIIDETGKAHFLEMAKWTKFLAIMGFIMMGIMIVAGLFMGSIFASIPGYNAIGAVGGIGFALIYSLFAAIYFYPVYALYKFSTLIKPAIAHNDTAMFNEAIAYKKNMYKYMGILMIIVLAMYALIFMFAIMVGIVGAMG